MKNFIKLFGIAALVAVIGFSMVGCEEKVDDPFAGATVTIYNTATVNGNPPLPSVSVKVGDKLACSANVGSIKRVEWARGDTYFLTDMMGGSDPGTYTVGQADVGYTIKVKVIVEKEGQRTTLTSALTAVVVAN